MKICKNCRVTIPDDLREYTIKKFIYCPYCGIKLN